ncbi:MAG: porin, partial [Thermodesulfobacteriota bacterium]
MRRLLYLSICVFLLTFIFTSSSLAFMLGEETKGVTLKAGDNADLNIRVRLQPRLDFGEIVENSAGTSYDSESDLYFRRVRLELKGHLIERLKYNLTLDADKWDKTGNADSVDLYYAYLRYHHADHLNVEFGKHKLPYSRISLTSSANQLLIERPASTEEAKGLFGDYGQMMIAADGNINKLKEGELIYYVAIADGISPGDTVAAGRTAQSAGP